MDSTVVPSTSTSLSGISAGDKDAFWRDSDNWKRELRTREGYPHGHTLNPRDGFWDW